MKYSLQANRKTLEGSAHPDRDAQFQRIAGQSAEFMAAGQPVISVDSKKELVGPYHNTGREYRPPSPSPVSTRRMLSDSLFVGAAQLGEPGFPPSNLLPAALDRPLKLRHRAPLRHRGHGPRPQVSREFPEDFRSRQRLAPIFISVQPSAIKEVGP